MSTISVVIPTYNRAAYIGQAIESVCRQTFQEWEVVVVDDGSTDQTREVVAPYLTDRRIRYLSQAHQERSAARNRGIDSSSTPYVALLDADDCWMPDKLAKQVAAMAGRLDAGLCYTLTQRINAAGVVLDSERDAQVLAGWILPQLLRSNCIGTSSVLIRRSCLERVGLFDTTLPAYGREDWDLWIRIARRYPVLLVEEELTRYRVYEDNSSQEQNFQSGLAVLKKLCRDQTLLEEAEMSGVALRAYLHLSAAAAPSDELPRAARAKRLAWTLVHYPPSVFSRAGLTALTRLLLPREMVKVVRMVYRKGRLILAREERWRS